MAENLQPNSAEWWLVRLDKELNDRVKRVEKLEQYYEGPHPMPEPPRNVNATAEIRAQWAYLAACGVTNWSALVADAPAERLNVIGFRFGDNESGDKDAWRLWQGNQLDADSDLVHGTALQTGQSFAMVWPSDSSPVGVDITVEHPSETIVAYRPGSRRARAAALKRWIDDDGYVLANVYLPDGIWKFRSRQKFRPGRSAAAMAGSGFTSRWAQREVAGEDWPLANPLSVVPIVEFRANAKLKASLFGGGYAEFEKVLSIQDRINKTIFDRMVTAESQAFLQRVIIGWQYPTITDAATGAQVPDRQAIQRAGANRNWVFPTGVDVKELGQASFDGFITAVEADVSMMAAITKTPPHYLLGKMINIAADALKAAEAGLVAKCRRHANNFGESWEEVLRLALKAVDDPKADDISSMIQWDDMESRTWAQTVDAVVKMKDLEVPREELWLRLPETTPQDVQRWKAMEAAEQLRREALGITDPALVDTGNTNANQPV